MRDIEGKHPLQDTDAGDQASTCFMLRQFDKWYQLLKFAAIDFML
jgi:hypothetical protein